MLRSPAAWLVPWFRNPNILLLATIAFMFLLLFIRHELGFSVALSWLRRGDYERALRRLELLERLGLSSATLLFLKGTVLMFAGRNQEAEEVLRKCIATLQPPMKKALALVNLGYVLLDQRRYNEAAQALDEAIQIRPDGAVAYSTRAEVFLQRGVDPQKALELLDRGIHYKQRSVIQSGRDVHVFGYLAANRAWALFLLHRLAEAEQALKEAEKSFRNAAISERFKPGQAGIRYHMGRALLAGGDAVRAQGEFRQAIEIDPAGKYAALSRAALQGQGV